MLASLRLWVDLKECGESTPPPAILILWGTSQPHFRGPGNVFFGIVILSLFVFEKRIVRTSEVPGEGARAMLSSLVAFLVFVS